MKRVITITMDIDESTHQAKVYSQIKEDGKVKKEWTAPQGVSTALVLIEAGQKMLGDVNDFMIDCLKKDRSQE